nr:RNA-directed DNA polymerase, eukaryota, reverse transcriptase zinc-binding domain protein [Tanacetum cinerariifolium]
MSPRNRNDELKKKTIGSKRKGREYIVDDDDENNGTKKMKKKSKIYDENNKNSKIRTRTTPTTLFNAMDILNGDRKKCLDEMGFGSMIGMGIHELPGKLGVCNMNILKKITDDVCVEKIDCKMESDSPESDDDNQKSVNDDGKQDVFMDVIDEQSKEDICKEDNGDQTVKHNDTNEDTGNTDSAFVDIRDKQNNDDSELSKNADAKSKKENEEFDALAITICNVCHPVPLRVPMPNENLNDFSEIINIENYESEIEEFDFGGDTDNEEKYDPKKDDDYKGEFYKSPYELKPIEPKIRVSASEKLVADTLFAMMYKLRGKMAQINTWRDTMEKVKKRLSNWKMNMLSIGGRLTLVKSVLGSMPLYQFLLFKVPMGVLNYIETLRSRFLNGCVSNNKKAICMNWKNALAPKDRGGLGISSLYAMNKGLLFKWIWRFLTQKKTMWARVIQAIHGVDGKIGSNIKGGLVMGRIRSFGRIDGLRGRAQGQISSPVCVGNENPRGGLEMDQLANLKDLMKE